MHLSQVPVAHACNPSYSGDRDQEDHGLKPAQANSSQDPISKKPITKKQNKKNHQKNPSQKRAGEVTQGVGPEFKPQYKKKKERKKPTYGGSGIILEKVNLFKVHCTCNMKSLHINKCTLYIPVIYNINIIQK
jgi:hypothetical protein